MKIRTQLLLACFILSVLPLTGIVFYSYRSSKKALEDAYQSEARHLTAQIDRRLGAIRADLDQRLAGLSAIPLTALKRDSKTDPAHTQVVDNILMAMGEAAPLVDALEFVPVAPPTPPPTSAVAATRAAHPAPVAEPAPQIAGTDPANADETDETDVVTPATPRDVESLTERVVIDLPPVRFPKFTMPPDFNRRVSEITALSMKLSNQELTKEERDAIRVELREKQKQLDKDMEASRTTFHAAMQQAQQQREERDRIVQHQREVVLEQRLAERERERAIREGTPATPAAPKVAVAPAPAPRPVARIVSVRTLTHEQKQMLKQKERQASLLFGQKFNVPLHSEGEVVGQIRAQLSTDEVVKRVLGSGNEESGEIPFAVDREGTVYTRTPSDRAVLERLGLLEAMKNKKPVPRNPNWIVSMSFHKDSGLRIGVARPVGENLEELRKTAAQNFGLGIGVIALALIGFLPVASHFSRDVKTVTRGAERIAQGDLTTRLPVHSKSEFGQLALAFNKMATDLSHQQERLLNQERMSIEYERKSEELEEARRFQLSMLPKQVPVHDRYDIAVFTQTAAEVGGDYYDFHLSPGGVLSVTIGDATGHGAKAGTMVTIIKTLFAGYSAEVEPAIFLHDAAEKIKRMDLGRMAMALSLARFGSEDPRTRGPEDKLTVSSAGMPPVLVHRATTGAVDEVALGATPLGTLGVDYEQTDVTIAKGDTVLLMSDGFPELLNAQGHQLGYVGAMKEFVIAAGAPDADGVIASLAEAARHWHGEQPPNDDITFVVVRCLA